MPLPTRNVDETHDQFIERCMADPVMVREFPDAAQRRAICQRQAKVKVHADGMLNLISEPGSITIEAMAEGAVEGQDAARPDCRGSRWWLTPAGRCGWPAGGTR